MSSAPVFPMNMIRLCVDRYGEDLSGRAYNKMMLVPLLFAGYSGLLLEMDDLFEKIGYPQAFQARRSFHSLGKLKGSIHIPSRVMDDEEMEKQSGSRRTFDIVVQSRRQSSWQGILMDPGRTSVKKFHSEMELLKCICRELDENFQAEGTAETGNL